jgi:hypothetical protein
MMFCKPPCPDMDDAMPAPEAEGHCSGREDPRPPLGLDAFGRLTTPGMAGPEQRLPPAAARTG